MTLEQLQAMSDKEVNQLSAVKVCGWQLETRSGYIDNNWVTETGLIHINNWNPTTDMNDAMRLAEHAVNGSKYSDVTISIPMCVVIFHRHTVEELIVDTEDSLPRAITIAAILAKESEQG